MKKPMLLALVAVVTTVPLFAQSLELIGRYAWMTTEASQDLEGTSSNNPVTLEVDDERGYGAAINVYLTRNFSAEIGGWIMEPDAIVTQSGDISAALLGSHRIIPITAVLQYHFSPDGAWDFYLGAGGAWVLIDDIEGDDDDVESEDIERIEFDDDVGLAVNLGVNIALTDTILLNIDAKYVPLEAASTVVFGSGEARPGRDISFNPLIISVGASLRF